METVVAKRGENAIDRLVHSLEANGALWKLGQVHDWQTGSLRKRQVNTAVKGWHATFTFSTLTITMYFAISLHLPSQLPALLTSCTNDEWESSSPGRPCGGFTPSLYMSSHPGWK